VVCGTSGEGALDRAVDAIWKDIAMESAEEGAAYARSLGLDARAATPESGHGNWQALLEGARDAGASAILVGSHGRGAITSTVLDSVASGLVHAAALPVLVVPRQRASSATGARASAPRPR
jgi:nucleotide-binding universal stress UspA family protein